MSGVGGGGDGGGGGGGEGCGGEGGGDEACGGRGTEGEISWSRASSAPMPPEYATVRQTSTKSTALAEIPVTDTCARAAPVLVSGTGPVADVTVSHHDVVEASMVRNIATFLRAATTPRFRGAAAS